MLPWLRRILGALDVASVPEDLNLPTFRLHPLKGNLQSFWSIVVNGNWRVMFRFAGADVELVNYLDYHWKDARMMPPPHPGELLREDVVAGLGLSVAKTAAHLGMSRVAFSRVLNGKAAISPDLAIRLERAGISTARAWLAMQSNYNLAQAMKIPQPAVQPLWPGARPAITRP